VGSSEPVRAWVPVDLWITSLLPTGPTGQAGDLWTSSLLPTDPQPCRDCGDRTARGAGTVEGAITADGIYKMVKHYAKRVGVDIEGFGAHSLRATAATNALDHEADIAKVQKWLEHAILLKSRRKRNNSIHIPNLS
jgi:hypothetical protein